MMVSAFPNSTCVMDQRFYASSYGRFNSPDPYGGSMSPSDSISWNRYSFVLGDPVNRSDPSGLYAVSSASGGDAFCVVGVGERREVTPCDILTVHTVGKETEINNDGLLAEWDNLSDKCKQGLKAAVGGPIASVKALNRALAASVTLENATAGTLIDWTMLAAIGIRETGFANRNEVDGAGVGVGVFQITVSARSGVSSSTASNLASAASWGVQYLTASATQIGNAIPGLSQDQAQWMLAASWNTGARGQINRYNNGDSPDWHTAPM